MAADAPSKVRTACSRFHLTIKARLSGPALAGSVASRALFVGMMTRSVQGQGARISSAPTRKAKMPVCHQATTPSKNASTAKLACIAKPLL